MPGSWRVVLMAAAGLAAGLNTAPAQAASDVVVVFDASNSMNSRFQKSRRITEAKQALIDAARLTGVNPGLVVFGHRQPQSCRDIETLVPANANNPAGLASALAGVRARGVTPMASALRRAATDASHRNQPARVIVLADGAGVKSCRIDTCATAAELKSEAVDLTFSVVAISPKPEEVASLRCIAQVTGGTYQEVRDKRSLQTALVQALGSTALRRTARGAVPPPRRKPQLPVAFGAVPPPRPKPADLQSTSVAVESGAGASTGFNTTVFAPTSSGEPPAVVAPPVPAAPAAPAAAASETAMAPTVPAVPSPAAGAGNSTTMAPSPPSQPAANQTAKSVVIPPPPPPPVATPAPTGAQPGLPKVPPRTTILVKRPPANAKAPAAAKKTGVAQPTPQANATGVIKLQAFVIEKSKPIPAGLLWQVFQAKPDNTRGKLFARSSDPAPELKVPVGTYDVVAIFGQATNAAKVQVTKGKTATGNVVLNAGGLQLIPLVNGTALTSDNITNVIYRSDDPRNPVVKDAASGSVIYLNAGIFKIVSRYGNVNAVARADVVVQRGKLTQAKINHRAGPAQFRLTDKAGGAPLAGTQWEISDTDGRVLKRSEETTPRYILAEGKYTVAVIQAGKTYKRDFSVASGRPVSVEVLTK